MPSALSGKALTVLGAVDADTMGVTLPTSTCSSTSR